MGIFTKKPKPTPSQKLEHVAKISNAVSELLKNKTIKIESDGVYLFSELWYDKKTAEAWMKNLFIYCSLLKEHTKEQILYFRNIETSEIIGFYKDGKGKMV